MVQKRETKAINKLCVREILSLSFVCGAYFFEFRGRNLVCFGIAYNFDWGRHWQIRAGSREGTHAHCVFHACRLHKVKITSGDVTTRVAVRLSPRSLVFCCVKLPSLPYSSLREY